MNKKLINDFDEVIRWPKKPSDKKTVMMFLGDKFNCNVKYSEKEVNKIIDEHHLFSDIALLRRELISRKVLFRRDDGSEYWKSNDI